MPPRPLRLPFYRNAGAAGEKPAPQTVTSWRASRRRHRVRSAGSDRHTPPRGAHHHGPPAGSSSPRPRRTATRAPASTARRPTTAPPAQRPSPPRRGDTQSTAPAGRLQVHRRKAQAGSAWPPFRSRSSPVPARWSIATNGLSISVRCPCRLAPPRARGRLAECHPATCARLSATAVSCQWVPTAARSRPASPTRSPVPRWREHECARVSDEGRRIGSGRLR